MESIRQPNEVRQEIQILLTEILSHLVLHPETVKVQTNVGECTTIFYIDTDQRNLGQIIGVRGRNIHSLRTLVSSIAGRHNIRAIVEIPYFKKQD